jgi:hypothetical protein
MRTCTGSPFWFSVVVRTLISPCSGRDFHRRTSSTSLSTHRSSPGRTGRGQRNSSKPAPTMPDGLELALDQEPHADRGGVPTAGGQSAEEGVARGLLVEMEGPRIEVGGDGLDPLCVDP